MGHWDRIAVAVLCVCAGAAQAQPPVPSRADQAEAFERMRAKPDDLDLMFRYAELSISLKDYEAAISTLERMLIYRQDLPRVRLELGVAYFALGSYEAATLYFDQVLANPGTPQAVRDRVERFKAEIAGRTQPHSFRGMASLGLTYATNANLGPDDANVSLFGNDATLDAASTSRGDAGARVLVGVTHTYDLQGANADVWQTDASFFGLRYGAEDSGNLLFARLRTGPKLAVDDDQYGPKIRPYVEGSYLYSDDDALYAAYGFGGEYSNTLDDQWSVFADTSLSYRNFFDPQDDEDGFVVRGLVGAAFVPLRNVVLRGSLTGQTERARLDANSNIELGARLGAEWAYDSGMDWAGSLWSLSGYVEGRTRFFDQADPVIDPNTTRRDLDLRAGISHLVALQDGFGVQLDVDGLWRNSTVPNFDLSNLSVTVSLQYKF